MEDHLNKPEHIFKKKCNSNYKYNQQQKDKHENVK